MKLRLLLFSAAALIAPTLPARAQDVQGLVFPVKQVSISSPVLQEVVEAVPVEEGDVVKEGQVVVQLRGAKESLSVQEAEKLVENASFLAKGNSSLYESKMGSKDAALKAQTELDLAKIRLALAHEQLREKTIRTTLAGIVVKKYKEAGESVDRVEKLIDVVNIDQVLVQFYLSPKFLQLLKVKQPITVRIPDLNNLSLTGEINFMDPRVDASSGLFRVKILVENRDHRVKPGLKAVADFTKAN